MKEILGRTRNGHEVWIKVLPSNMEGMRLRIANFPCSEDNYDAFCIVEAYLRRLEMLSVPHGNEASAATRENLVKYLNGPKPSGFNSEAVVLGHRTAPHRLRHGMRLLHPAYRW